MILTLQRRQNGRSFSYEFLTIVLGKKASLKPLPGKSAVVNDLENKVKPEKKILKTRTNETQVFS